MTNTEYKEQKAAMLQRHAEAKAALERLNKIERDALFSEYCKALNAKHTLPKMSSR